MADAKHVQGTNAKHVQSTKPKLTLTKTHKAILKVLSDGRPHKRDELRACLNDDMAGRTTLAMHISNIRKRIRHKNQDILCVLRDRTIFYCHVKLLKPFIDS